jgi:hypothetical protein
MDQIADHYRGYQLAAFRSGDGWQVDIVDTPRRTTRFANVAAAMTEARRLVDLTAAATLPRRVAKQLDANGLAAQKR